MPTKNNPHPDDGRLNQRDPALVTQVSRELLDRMRTGYREHAPDVSEAAIEMNQRLLSTEAARIAAFVRRLVAKNFSKATGQYLVLRDLYFASDRRRSQREIRRIQSMSPANVTRIVHALEVQGLVRRSLDGSDKRKTFVELTPAGEEVCVSLVPEMAAFRADAAACFSPGELILLNELLARLQDHLESLDR